MPRTDKVDLLVEIAPVVSSTVVAIIGYSTSTGTLRAVEAISGVAFALLIWARSALVSKIDGRRASTDGG
jgi:hypothetical protein